MVNTIPGILPPHIQYELQDEMTQRGFDPSGHTDGKGWSDFAEYCRGNPGECRTFDRIRDALKNNDGNSPMERLDRTVSEGLNWFYKAKGSLMNTFGDSSFDPDNQEIYRNRDAIKLAFQSEYVAATANGEPMDPEIVERLEQLAAVHPDEVDERYVSALNKITADPAKFGLETESPGMFSNNEGLKFTTI